MAESQKAVKNKRKAERKAAEAARKAEVAKMMAMEMSEDEEEEEEDIASAKVTKGGAVDRFGNTIEAKSGQNAKLEAERAAARLRREAKLKKEAETKEVVAPSATMSEKSKDEVSTVKAKAAAGKKLSNKERKLLKKAEAQAERAAAVRNEAADPLAHFTLSVMNTMDEEAEEAQNTRQKQIRMSGVSISAPAKPLLIDADIKLSCGRRYAILGKNGSGKTTLLRFLASGKLRHSVDSLLVDQESTNIDESRSVLEQVLAADTNVARVRQRLLQAETALENASDTSSLEKARNEIEACCEELESTGAAGHEARARCILAGLGFDDTAIEAPGAVLSGGWRMRVNLAKALFVRPTLCLLDEPSNHLDLEAVIWLFDFLVSKDFRQDGILVVCSHDYELLEEVCTDYILLEDEQLEYHRSGLPQLRSGREARRKKALRDHEKHLKAVTEERKKHPNASTEKLHDKVKQRLNLSRLILERPRDYTVHFDFGDFGHENLANVGGISLRNISFTYDEARSDTKKAPIASFGGFENIDFDLSPSTRSALLGPNGAGKSTLLKLLSGQLIPSFGDRLVSTKCRVGVYDQHFSLLADCGRTTATKLLMERFSVQEHNARATLGKFGLDGPRHLVPIPELSGGQKARVVFAALSLMKPHILLLDEPTNHLDIESVEALIDGIRSFKGGVLAVSHDPALIDALARDPETGVEQPLFVCEKGIADSDTKKAMTVPPSLLRIEQGGFPAYRRKIQRQALEREARLAKEAEERMASVRLFRGRARKVEAAAPSLGDGATTIDGETTKEGKSGREDDDDDDDDGKIRTKEQEQKKNSKVSSLFGGNKKKK